MDNQDDFVLLFPTCKEQNEEESFSEDEQQQEPSFEASLSEKSHHLDYEQQEIDEEILKKTSELHQALRNIKLLKFQLIQSKIMKRTNLKKCEELEQNISKNQKRKQFLEQQNEQIENTIQLYKQKIIRQRESNQHLNSNLQNLNHRLIQAKIQHKNITNHTNFAFNSQDKENISGIQNKLFIQLQKISLQAKNHTSQETIEILKQEIITIKQKFKAKENRKKQLQTQYQELVQNLKKQQNQNIAIKNLKNQRQNSTNQEPKLLEEIDQGRQNKQIYNHNMSITQFNRQNIKKQHSKMTQNPQKNITKTQNKDKKKGKSITTTNSTLKKHRIF